MATRSNIDMLSSLDDGLQGTDIVSRVSLN